MYSKLDNINVFVWLVVEKSQDLLERSFEDASNCIKKEMNGNIVDIKYCCNTVIQPENYDIVSIFSAIIIYECKSALHDS